MKKITFSSSEGSISRFTKRRNRGKYILNIFLNRIDSELCNFSNKHIYKKLKTLFCLEFNMYVIIYKISVKDVLDQ